MRTMAVFFIFCRITEISKCLMSDIAYKFINKRGLPHNIMSSQKVVAHV